MKVDDLDVVAAADLGLLDEWAVGLDALGELIGPRFFRRGAAGPGVGLREGLVVAGGDP
jgi:hypothetical protein